MPYVMISVFKVTYLAVTGGKTEEDVTNNGGYIWPCPVETIQLAWQEAQVFFQRPGAGKSSVWLVQV